MSQVTRPDGPASPASPKLAYPANAYDASDGATSKAVGSGGHAEIGLTYRGDQGSHGEPLILQSGNCRAFVTKV
jgi:hypothetical protein